MSAAYSVQRLSSRHGNSVGAYEVVSRPLTLQAICPALKFLKDIELPEAAFVALKFESDDGSSIREAVRAVSQATLSSRLCFYIDQATLKTIDFKDFDDDRVGLILDGVTAETALSNIAHQAIEAVRFEAEFVDRACRDLRWSSVLEAMIGLAGNLGLCKIGPCLATVDPLIERFCDFDFVPSGSYEEKTGPATERQRKDEVGMVLHRATFAR